jgi:uncharacterized membrane protein
MSTTDFRGDDPGLAPLFAERAGAHEAGKQLKEPGQRRDASPGARACERMSRSCSANVGMSERLASLVAGTTLGAFGLFRAQRGRLPLAALGAGLVYRGLSGHCWLYQKLGVNTAEGDDEHRGLFARREHSDATVIPARHGEKVEKSVTIQKLAEELYSFWREVENLPKVMKHLRRVEAVDRNRSHWVADGAFGREVEWDAEISDDRENEMIAWRSLPGSAVDTAGSVHFKELPHDRGTQVTVSLKYNPPAGKVGAWLATLTGDGLASKLAEDLRNFKRTMEAGEIPVAFREAT